MAEPVADDSTAQPADQAAPSLDEKASMFSTQLASFILSLDEKIATWEELTKQLCDRYERGGDPADLGTAISFGEKLLVMANETANNSSTVLSELIRICCIKSQHDGDDDEVKKLLDKILQPVNSTSEDDPVLPDMLLEQGSRLLMMYRYLDDKAYMDEALKMFEKAIELSTNADAKALAHYHKSDALSSRYGRTLGLEDLNLAISLAEDGFDLAEDECIKGICAAALSGFLVTLARRRSDHVSLVLRAMEFADSGLNLLPAEHPARSRCRNNLGLAHLLKYDKDDGGGDIRDLDQARECLRAISSAVDSRELDNISPNALLSLSYRKLFDRTKKIEYLDKAIDHSMHTVDAAKSQKTDFLMYQTNHANLLKLRFKMTEKQADLERAVDIYLSILDEPLAGTFERISSGVQLCAILLSQGYLVQSYKALRRSVQLMPKLTKGSIQRQDQQWFLSWLSSLSPQAASLALKSGETASTAFHLLELGRCTMLNLTIFRRSKLDESLFVGAEAQALMERYEQVQEQISGPILSVSSQPTPDISVRISTRYQQMKTAEELETAIRKLPGLGNFQQSLSENEIKQLAGADFLVAFNISALSSHAFIITSSDIGSINLPDLDYDDAQTFLGLVCGSGRITKTSFRTFSEDNKKMASLLSWLWDVAVKPVFSHLQLLNKSPPNQLPMVYWIMSSILGLMPLHAAGRYTDGSDEYAMRYIVSSYLLSSKAFSWSLDRIRYESLSQITDSDQSLFVSMPTTPGMPDLDCSLEAEAFKSCMPNVTISERQSSSTIFNLIRDTTFLHCACHATADPIDPSNSRIMLYDKEQDTVDPLTINALSCLHSAQSRPPRFAYLSACETADMQALDLVDESVHIAAAFQAMGFPHVIATMWEAQHNVANEVATAFYSSLKKEGVLKLLYSREREEHQKVERILHKVILELVSRDPDEPLSWANFVHFGV